MIPWLPIERCIWILILILMDLLVTGEIYVQVAHSQETVITDSDISSERAAAQNSLNQLVEQWAFHQVAEGIDNAQLGPYWLSIKASLDMERLRAEHPVLSLPLPGLKLRPQLKLKALQRHFRPQELLLFLRTLKVHLRLSPEPASTSDRRADIAKLVGSALPTLPPEILTVSIETKALLHKAADDSTAAERKDQRQIIDALMALSLSARSTKPYEREDIQTPPRIAVEPMPATDESTDLRFLAILFGFGLFFVSAIVGYKMGTVRYQPTSGRSFDTATAAKWHRSRDFLDKLQILWILEQRSPSLRALRSHPSVQSRLAPPPAYLSPRLDQLLVESNVSDREKADAVWQEEAHQLYMDQRAFELRLIQSMLTTLYPALVAQFDRSLGDHERLLIRSIVPRRLHRPMGLGNAGKAGVIGYTHRDIVHLRIKLQEFHQGQGGLSVKKREA